jgi:hypothetical protein
LQLNSDKIDMGLLLKTADITLGKDPTGSELVSIRMANTED